jgi:hypothetical protein
MSDSNYAQVVYGLAYEIDSPLRHEIDALIESCDRFVEDWEAGLPVTGEKLTIRERELLDLQEYNQGEFSVSYSGSWASRYRAILLYPSAPEACVEAYETQVVTLPSLPLRSDWDDKLKDFCERHDLTYFSPKWHLIYRCA